MFVFVFGVVGFGGVIWFVICFGLVVEVEFVVLEFVDVMICFYLFIFGFVEVFVMIVEFFDLVCEVCCVFYFIVKDIMVEYGDVVCVVICYMFFYGVVFEEVICVFEVVYM